MDISYFDTNICLTQLNVNRLEGVCQAKIEMSYSYQNRNVRFYEATGSCCDALLSLFQG